MSVLRFVPVLALPVLYLALAGCQGQTLPAVGDPLDAGDSQEAVELPEVDDEPIDDIIEPVGQHQHGNVHLDWSLSAPTTTVSQTFTPVQMSAGSFVALVFPMDPATGRGGYLGYQPDGQVAPGVVGPTALFSIWDALDAEGPGCIEFGGEGTGWSCRAELSVADDEAVTFDLELEMVGSERWWRVNASTASATVDLGRILPGPEMQEVIALSNFVEYYGPQTDCDAVPYTAVLFDAPIDMGGMDSEPGNAWWGDCAQASVVTEPDVSLGLGLP